jgi:hypothetical protein
VSDCVQDNGGQNVFFMCSPSNGSSDGAAIKVANSSEAVAGGVDCQKTKK